LLSEDKKDGTVDWKQQGTSVLGDLKVRLTPQKGEDVSP